MKRIRTIMLTSFAALALTASVGATSASASGFVTAAYPASIATGQAQQLSISLGSFGWSCSSSPELAGELVHAVSTLSPYAQGGAKCNGGSIGTADLAMNGCTFIFHAGQETAPGKFSGTFDIGPAGCGPVTLSWGSCIKYILPQTGLSVSYENQGEGSKAGVGIGVNTVGVAYQTNNPGVTCGSKEGYGSMVASWTANAKNIAGEYIGMHLNQTGVFLNGPSLEAEAYPVALVGDQDAGKPQELTFPSRPFKCAEISYYGSASGPVSSFNLDANYGNCTSIILGAEYPASVVMNSCRYALSVAGKLSVVCTGQGDAIEARAYASVEAQKANEPFCVYRIGPQEGISGVSYSNSGEGSARKVNAALSLSLSYSRTVGGIVSCGAKTGSVTYTGGLTLGGAR